MKDIQSTIDERGIAIQKVGIRDVHLPIQIKTEDGSFQQVLASIQFTVSLPMEYKGTHMSRFVEILNKWSAKPFAEEEMNAILFEAMEKLEAESADLILDFKYFIQRFAPVSGKRSLLDVDCSFSGSLKRGEKMQFTLGVKVPYTSLCPCSKEISQYGAHNQRGMMNVRLSYKEGFDCIFIEKLVNILAQQGSCQVQEIVASYRAMGAKVAATMEELQDEYGVNLLKREDEKYVTEHAYDNPKCVEDILRDGVLVLRELDGLKWFSLECENYESIHNHSAYAAHEEVVGKNC